MIPSSTLKNAIVMIVLAPRKIAPNLKPTISTITQTKKSISPSRTYFSEGLQDKDILEGILSVS